jgi:hypothetical protein
MDHILVVVVFEIDKMLRRLEGKIVEYITYIIGTKSKSLSGSVSHIINNMYVHFVYI